MKIQLAIFTLATLVTLSTGCDPETAEPSLSEPTFRGDDIDPPTRTTTGVFKIGGGHEWLDLLFDQIPASAQMAYYKHADKRAAELVLESVVDDERNAEHCLSACARQQTQWNGEFTVQYLHVEHGRVASVELEEGMWAWESQAQVTAEIGCVCVP